MKQCFLPILLITFFGCDKIITNTKYNADMDICTSFKTIENPSPTHICTNSCKDFKCPANYVEYSCLSDPNMFKLESLYKDVRITKYRVDGKEVARTYSSTSLVCNWGSLTRACIEGFNRVIEERCY